MAAYISVPRDLTRVKSKVLFNLTAAAADMFCRRSRHRHSGILPSEADRQCLSGNAGDDDCHAAPVLSRNV